MLACTRVRMVSVCFTRITTHCNHTTLRRLSNKHHTPHHTTHLWWNVRASSRLFASLRFSYPRGRVAIVQRVPRRLTALLRMFILVVGRHLVARVARSLEDARLKHREVMRQAWVGLIAAVAGVLDVVVDVGRVLLLARECVIVGVEVGRWV